MGAVNTTYTFTATDVITSTKMNNIIGQTVMEAGAIVGTTLAIASGKLKVNSAGITSNELSAGCVTSNALASDSVITAKILDSNITTAKIADSAVTTAKVADSAVTTAKVADAAITAPKLDGAQTGSAPIYGVRAFASFNGQATTPISPISSGNIASIVRTATGTYTVTLTTPMSNANYCVVANATHAIGTTYGTNCWVIVTNASSFVISTGQVGGSLYNSPLISFVVMQ